ncbi:MAG: hypothetical protein RMJ36_05930 [Candidatus Calescibacterium sp.]|nr:hypothetical protein [Candidatus Calescibacterium sp.]MDW8133175.1 hypothetical protein [Candidatus Calescibacterium sp.]
MGMGLIPYKKEKKGKLIEINEIEALEKLQKKKKYTFQMTKFSNFNISVSNLFAYGALVSLIDTEIVKNV